MKGYIPSLLKASPTHLLTMTATMMGTMYTRPPVSSNMITTSETIVKERQPYNISLEYNSNDSGGFRGGHNRRAPPPPLNLIDYVF